MSSHTSVTAKFATTTRADYRLGGARTAGGLEADGGARGRSTSRRKNAGRAVVALIGNGRERRASTDRYMMKIRRVEV